MTKPLSVILTGLLAVAVPATASAALPGRPGLQRRQRLYRHRALRERRSCTAGTALNCNDNNPCTIDSCDALPSVASTRHAVAGSSCSDGNVCNGAETCQGTVCTAGTPAANGIACDDGQRLHDQRDLPQRRRANGGSNRPNGTQCSDGNPRSGLEVCLERHVPPASRR